MQSGASALQNKTTTNLPKEKLQLLLLELLTCLTRSLALCSMTERSEVCQKATRSRTGMWKCWGCGQRIGMDRKCALIGFVWLRESRGCRHTEEGKSLRTDCPVCLSGSWEIPRAAQKHLPTAWPVLCAACAAKAEELPRKMCIKLGKGELEHFLCPFLKSDCLFLCRPAKGLNCHNPFLVARAKVF